MQVFRVVLKNFTRITAFMLTFCIALTLLVSAETNNKKVVDHLQQKAENQKEVEVSVDDFDMFTSSPGFFKPQVKSTTSETLWIFAALFGLIVTLFIIYVITINFKNNKQMGKSHPS